MRALPTLMILLLAGPCFAEATPPAWPTFRGPLHTGVAPGADPPVEWAEDKNVRWKVALEGTGHSSPVIWGDRIYVLSAAEVASEAPAPAPAAAPAAEGEAATAPPLRLHRFLVSAYDLGSGERVWRTVVREEIPHESLHPTASQASPSPVTDGKHVWAFFGSRGLYCLDVQGNLVWEADLGTLQTRNAFGEGASPLVHGDLVVVNWDHEGESFIVALDKRTGEQRWRAARDEITSWSTPIVVRDGERDVIVVSAANSVRAYDLLTGKELWSVKGLGPNVIPTPVADDTTVWLMSGWREPRGMAVRYRGATGDLTGTDRVSWQIDSGLSYVPSPVLVDGRLFFYQRFTGILSCYELASGKPCYDQQRIENFDDVYASPVAAAGRIYTVSRDGTAVVLRAGEKFEVLARNVLEDSFNATPAIVGPALVLRGDRHLYKIAAD